MNRKDYLKPTMQVVKLQHTQMLMVSGVEANRSGYGTANEDTWGDEAGVKANNYSNPVDWDND